jgi:hypothetical protein
LAESRADAREAEFASRRVERADPKVQSESVEPDRKVFHAKLARLKAQLVETKRFFEEERNRPRVDLEAFQGQVIKQVRTVAQQKDQELRDLRAKLKETEALLQAERKRAADAESALRGKVSQLKTKCHDITGILTASLAEVEVTKELFAGARTQARSLLETRLVENDRLLESERRSHRAELATLNSALAARDTELKAARLQIEKLVEANRALFDERKALTTTLASTRSGLDALQSELWDVRGRIEDLANRTRSEMRKALKGVLHHTGSSLKALRAQQDALLADHQPLVCRPQGLSILLGFMHRRFLACLDVYSHMFDPRVGDSWQKKIDAISSDSLDSDVRFREFLSIGAISQYLQPFRDKDRLLAPIAKSETAAKEITDLLTSHRNAAWEQQLALLNELKRHVTAFQAQLSAATKLPVVSSDSAKLFEPITKIPTELARIAKSETAPTGDQTKVCHECCDQITGAWKTHVEEVTESLNGCLTNHRTKLTEAVDAGNAFLSCSSAYISTERSNDEAFMDTLYSTAQWLFDAADPPKPANPIPDPDPDGGSLTLSLSAAPPAIPVPELGELDRAAVTKAALDVQSACVVGFERRENLCAEIERCRKAIAAKDQELRDTKSSLQRAKDLTNDLTAKLDRMRRARTSEFALVRQRMEQKLAKVAEIHRLEVQALLDADAPDTGPDEE